MFNLITLVVLLVAVSLSIANADTECAPSQNCPVARCTAPPEGCQYVFDEFKLQDDGKCCPILCNLKCEDDGNSARTLKRRPGFSEHLTYSRLKVNSCNDFAGSCRECLNEGCFYQTQLGGVCTESCEIQDVSCYGVAAEWAADCPNDLLANIQFLDERSLTSPPKPTKCCR